MIKDEPNKIFEHIIKCLEMINLLEFELIKNVLIVGIASGIITTGLIQKIKQNLKTKKYIVLISFIVNMTIGTLFALSFSTVGLFNSLWAGLFSFIGADILYQMFEDKIFKPFSSMQNNVVIPTTNNMRENKEK